MLELAILAAAAIAKHAVLVGATISDSAYPLEARKAKLQGRSVVAFMVDQDGRPKGCVTSASSGSDVLDAQTCKLVASFRCRPALDDAGRPLPEQFNFAISWTLPKNLTISGPAPVRQD